MALKADDPAWAIGAKVEAFVRTTIIPYESDPRRDHHGAPTEELVRELRALARAEGLMTPHILPDGAHLTQEGTAYVLIRSGLSPLGPVALNTMAPDEGNMHTIEKWGTDAQKDKYLRPLCEGRMRSCFAMT